MRSSDNEGDGDGEEDEGKSSTDLKSKNACVLDHCFSDLSKIEVVVIACFGKERELSRQSHKKDKSRDGLEELISRPRSRQAAALRVGKARKQLSELALVKKQMAKLKEKHDQDVSDTRKAGYKEAKEAVMAHYAEQQVVEDANCKASTSAISPSAAAPIEDIISGILDGRGILITLGNFPYYLWWIQRR